MRQIEKFSHFLCLAVDAPNGVLLARRICQHIYERRGCDIDVAVFIPLYWREKSRVFPRWVLITVISLDDPQTGPGFFRGAERRPFTEIQRRQKLRRSFTARDNARFR